jgi:hypothetical protein
MSLHRLTRFMAALLLIGGVAGGVGLGMRARSAQPERERRAIAPAENKYRVALARGATFEVVAVSSFPSDPETWWRPDGTPLAEPLADLKAYRHKDRSDEAYRTVLVRISDLPNDATLRLDADVRFTEI